MVALHNKGINKNTSTDSMLVLQQLMAIAGCVTLLVISGILKQRFTPLLIRLLQMTL
jgi:hypothetical protein